MKPGPRSYRRWNASIGIFHVLLYLTLTVFGFAGTTLPAREQPGEADQGANQGFEEFPLRGNEVLTTKSLSEEVTYRFRYVSDRGFNRLAEILWCRRSPFIDRFRNGIAVWGW
jgi:hypothetical protein